jgi:hypothetical protein
MASGPLLFSLIPEGEWEALAPCGKGFFFRARLWSSRFQTYVHCLNNTHKRYR